MIIIINQPPYVVIEGETKSKLGYPVGTAVDVTDSDVALLDANSISYTKVDGSEGTDTKKKGK